MIVTNIIVFILFANIFIFDNCEHDYFDNSDGAEFRDAELDSKMEPQQQDQEAQHKKQSTHFHRGRFLGKSEMFGNVMYYRYHHHHHHKKPLHHQQHSTAIV